MSSRPLPALADLSDAELEVLRLLATGHTIKSIAATLGRSEASINERLRDARRKTGVGSSRELARQVAAQKNWDRTFDLPAGAPVDEDRASPAAGAGGRSKGALVMFAILPIALAGLALVQSGPQPAVMPPQRAQATPAAPSPLAGRWSLDTALIPAAERPRRVTITFRPAPGDKWATEVEIVAADGTVQRGESIAAADGVPVPVSGTLGFLDTVSLRQPAANTLVMTLGKNGAPVSTRVYTVAKDGASMTETIIWPGNSLPGLETTTFRRMS